MENLKRKGWIDIARAFAMFLVIFVHIGNELFAAGFQRDDLYTTINTFINPVKLPLFFAISGFLFSKKNDDTKFFINREIKTRLIPYIVWASFMGVIGSAMEFIRSGSDFSNLGSIFLYNYIVPFFRGNLIWFIPCLMVLEIIFFIFIKISRKNPFALAALTVAATTIGYLISTDKVLPWKVDTALTCTQFITFGYLIRKFFDSKFFDKHLKILIPSFSALYIVMILAMNRFWKGCVVDINTGNYFNPIAFSALAFSGVLCFFGISIAIKSFKPFEFVGRNTLIYFVWHMYVVNVLVIVIKKIEFLRCLPICVLCFALLVVSCFVVALVSVLVNRYIGFSVGNRMKK